MKKNLIASRAATTSSPFTIYGPNPKGRSKGTCAYCDRPIYRGGVTYKGRKYHETCAALKRRGVPAKVFKNPETRPPREFMADMLPSLAASYPYYGRARLGKIAAGIWWGFTPSQRRAYRERHAIPNVQYFKVRMNPFKSIRTGRGTSKELVVYVPAFDPDGIGFLINAKTGKATTRWADGTVGIPKEAISFIEEADTAYDPYTGEEYEWSHRNPLHRGERYLGKTKRGVSVKEAKRRGWL